MARSSVMASRTTVPISTAEVTTRCCQRSHISPRRTNTEGCAEVLRCVPPPEHFPPGGARGRCSARKIGRASCRESAENAVVAGAVKTKGAEEESRKLRKVAYRGLD